MTSNQINYFKAQEEARSNRANEAFKAEANVIAAVANDIARRNADTNALNANINLMNARTRENEYWETVRANIARENETMRSNMASENIRISQLNEQIRSNLANESITESYNAGRLSQGEATLWQQSAQRHLEEDKQAETVRHNLEMESLESRKTNQGAVSSLSNLFSKIVPAVGSFIGLLA